MSTRLDRLVLLLDTGSTLTVRKSAAEQIGQIAAQRPEDLHSLLAKVFGFVKSKSWETRVAASLAIEAIGQQTPQWDPHPAVGDNEVSASSLNEETWMLSFASFDIQNVVKNGVPLLSSPGKEFEEDEVDLTLDPKERIAKQKLQLKQKLGLGTEFMDGTYFLLLTRSNSRLF